MAARSYNKSSPYAKTNTFGNGQFLDLLVYPTIDKQVDDVQFTINSIYQYRPDILAYDLYGDTALWWVFRARNPNTLDDPVFDFQAGVTIYIPKKTTLVTNLGI
jgi:Base plate wedge protein 53